MKFVFYIFLSLAIFGFVACGPVKNRNSDYDDNHENKGNSLERRRDFSRSLEQSNENKQGGVRPLISYQSKSQDYDERKPNGGYKSNTNQESYRGRVEKDQYNNEDYNDNRSSEKNVGKIELSSQEKKIYGYAQNNAGWMENQKHLRSRSSVQQRPRYDYINQQ